MAGVIISEVLCFTVKNFSKLSRSPLIEIIAKFYHEDELYAAKVELNKHVSASIDDSTVLDGWAKIINKQGHPIVRKSADGLQRRTAEAEDVLYMLTILDVNKVDLRKFVAEDLDRVPIMAGCWSNDILGQSDATKILQRLDDMEKKLTSLTSTTNRQSSTSQAMSRSVSVTERFKEGRELLDKVVAAVPKKRREFEKMIKEHKGKVGK